MNAFRCFRCPARQRFRTGITLIELLVAMGIIAILASLFLPAVQSSREAARRVHCLANLRQLGTATEAFVTQRGIYPGIQREDARPQRNESFHARLLPFLEQRDLYTKLDRFGRGTELGNPPSAEQNAFALAVSIPVFVCPSDNVPTGGNSYRGCLGPTTGIHATWKPGVPLPGTIDMEGLAGIFQAEYRPQHIRDGLSHTVLWSERVVGDGNPETYTPFRDLAGLEGIDFYRPNDAAIGCAKFTAPDQHYSYLGSTWVLPDYAHTGYNHVLTPNSAIPDCMDPISNHFTHGAMTARSFHVGGVNTVFADGAGKFISDSIDLKVWRALGSINGGETHDDI